MTAASTKRRTTVSYLFLVKTSLLLLNNSFLELSAAVLVPLVGLPDLFLVVLAQPLPKAAEAFLT